MAELQEIIADMNTRLRVAETPDYPGAMNGLQLENNGRVTRVACAVDACEAVLRQAVRSGADLLLVHHGMFWGGPRPVTAAQYRKLKVAIDGNLAVYSAHIPLDIHPDLGNNAGLARAIGMTGAQPFFPWKGILLGLRGHLEISRRDLAERLESAVGGPVHLCPGGGEAAGMTGIITGGAGGEIGSLDGMGIDTFVTGEGPHWSYTLAEELGINVCYAGHYATETFGVKALAAHLEAAFGLPWSFIDHPSGL